MRGSICNLGCCLGLAFFIGQGSAWSQIGGGGSPPNRPSNTSPTNQPPGQTPPLGTAPERPKDSADSKKDEDVEKAREMMKKGDLKQALNILEDASKRRTELPPGKLMMARLCAEMNLPQQARQYLEQAAIDHANHPDIYITMGNIALADGRLTDALLHFREGMEVIKIGEWTDTQKKFVRLNCYNGLSAVAERRATWDKAHDYLKAALELEPTSGVIRHRFARALFMLEKRDEAANEFEKAYKDEPNLEPPGVTLARLYTQINNLPKAEEWFKYSASTDPNNLRVRNAFANWLVDLGRFEDARKEIKEALRIDGKSPEARSLMGYIYRVEKNYPEAERIFDELAREYPNNLYAANQLNLILISQPDDAKRRRAMESAQALLKKHGNDAELAVTMAWIFYKMNQIDEADKLFESVARATGGRITSDAAYFMANVLADRGKLEQVRVMLKGAVESPGRFAFRKDAEEWLKAIDKKP